MWQILHTTVTTHAFRYRSALQSIYFSVYVLYTVLIVDY